MLAQPHPPRQPSALQPPASKESTGADVSITPLGVGIDTARYGHYAAFLDQHGQQAAPELAVAESSQGYAQLRQRLTQLVHKHGRVRFFVRVDVAGAYADNLLAWLQQLAIDGGEFSLSCGDPQRNKNYRAAVYGSRKSDPVEARACARYALRERPRPLPMVSPQRQRLRQVALRLQAVVRQRTRLVNQLHQLLTRTFPELAVLVKDITAGWVLELVNRYPTAALLAQASTADLEAIPYLPHARIAELLDSAGASIGSLDGELAEHLVRDQVRQVRDGNARQKRLENLLISAYRALPEPNHLDSIIGFGEVTAAILTAFVADIGAVHTPGQLVNYFGVLPIEVSSGVDREGNPRGPKRYVMSRRGNDLVRRYLWMAALSASRHNPACRALYARVRAKHPQRPAIAIGHVMRKLLHLAFAVWKTGKPFDPEHYPWHAPAHVDGALPVEGETGGSDSGMSVSDRYKSAEGQAAGLGSGTEPIRPEVTAACPSTLTDGGTAVESAGVWLDFAHVKAQLSMARLLEHLGLTPRLRGPRSQKRCACPIHRGDGRGRTFSVNLEENVYQCFDATCSSRGDVIDLWAALHRLSLREAALDLVQTFGLEAAPGTEKRNG
jgi:transposase